MDNNFDGLVSIVGQNEHYRKPCVVFMPVRTANRAAESAFGHLMKYGVIDFVSISVVETDFKW